MIMDVIKKFSRGEGMTGNSLAINLTSALVDVIEKDIIANDFTPDEIADLQPRFSGRGFFSPVPPFRNDIWRSVIELGPFKYPGRDEDQWLASMDTLRNLDDDDWSSTAKAIENTWEKVKNSWPHYYLCIDGDDDCLCEVDSAGNKKVVSTWQC